SKKPQPEVFYPVRHAVSPAVRDMARLRPGTILQEWDHPVQRIPRRLIARRPNSFIDAAVQTEIPSLSLLAAPGVAFDGVGETTGYNVNGAPPDTNGAVGATQYVQWVNTAFAVFRKSDGFRLAGPTNGNVLFAALGGDCAGTNDGDPIASYDK